MKIIAFYLPQFHVIPENNEWWGEGFTEWTNVKKAEPLFEGHNQPRIPLNGNYYNLLEDNIKEWQVDLANKYGIYGFCIYHYWFNGKMLLEKPVNQFLENKNLNTHFCLCWANEAWTNAWAAKDPSVLIEQKYGDKEDWKKHFDYFLPFFKDSRYITANNKPLLVIYRPELIDYLNEMLDYWNDLAVSNGFDGIDYAYQHVSFAISPVCDESRFSYALEYHPNCARTMMDIERSPKLKKIKKHIVTWIEKKFGINLREYKKAVKGVSRFSYDETWEYIISMKPRTDKSVPGAFVDWDNTPRRKKTGSLAVGATPKKFERYMVRQIQNAKENYKKDMIFVFSWNEWAEGGYLEPDQKYKYEYLESIYNALKETEELEN